MDRPPVPPEALRCSLLDAARADAHAEGPGAVRLRRHAAPAALEHAEPGRICSAAPLRPPRRPASGESRRSDSSSSLSPPPRRSNEQVSGHRAAASSLSSASSSIACRCQHPPPPPPPPLAHDAAPSRPPLRAPPPPPPPPTDVPPATSSACEHPTTRCRATRSRAAATPAHTGARAASAGLSSSWPARFFSSSYVFTSLHFTTFWRAITLIIIIIILIAASTCCCCCCFFIATLLVQPQPTVPARQSTVSSAARVYASSRDNEAAVQHQVKRAGALTASSLGRPSWAEVRRSSGWSTALGGLLALRHQDHQRGWRRLVLFEAHLRVRARLLARRRRTRISAPPTRTAARETSALSWSF